MMPSAESHQYRAAPATISRLSSMRTFSASSIGSPPATGVLINLPLPPAPPPFTQYTKSASTAGPIGILSPHASGTGLPPFLGILSTAPSSLSQEQGGVGGTLHS